MPVLAMASSSSTRRDCNGAVRLPLEAGSVSRSSSVEFVRIVNGLTVEDVVCDWWHGVPQLFAKWGYYHYDNPSSCADVQLRPVYL